ncbi:MAG: hypothetical protein ABSG15_15085 [FCB group bacterium]|jgi:hypothetical protein
MHTFNDVIVAADELSFEDREVLIDILYKKQLEEKRNKLFNDVKESRREFATGTLKPKTTAQIMKEILG